MNKNRKYAPLETQLNCHKNEATMVVDEFFFPIIDEMNSNGCIYHQWMINFMIIDYVHPLTSIRW
jgi:hypothetical protein